MSNELVPIKTVRASYNLFLPPEQQLPHHKDNLTRDQAEVIGATFSPVEIYGIKHGIPIDHLSPDTEGELPTQLDYAVARAVVESLRPGVDTLFVERSGYSEATVRYDFPDSVYRDKHGNQREPSEIAHLKLIFAESMARSYTIDTLEYAAMVADAMDITVVNADLDKFDSDRAKTAVPKVLDSEQNPDFHHLRERAMVNIIKDWALENGKNVDGSTHDQELPRLVMLVGTAHVDNIRALLQNLGMNFSGGFLEASSAEDSLREQERLAAGNPPGILHLRLPRYQKTSDPTTIA